jgi:hypothetical protein
MLLLALALPAAAQAASYYPSGPQENVPRSTIATGGWSVCYDGDYSDHVSLAVILAACLGAYLMMAGTAVGSPDPVVFAGTQIQDTVSAARRIARRPRPSRPSRRDASPPSARSASS